MQKSPVNTGLFPIKIFLAWYPGGMVFYRSEALQAMPAAGRDLYRAVTKSIIEIFQNNDFVIGNSVPKNHNSYYDIIMIIYFYYYDLLIFRKQISNTDVHILISIYTYILVIHPNIGCLKGVI